MDEKITITVKTATGKQYTLQVSPNDTIEQVKKALEPQCEMAADMQRLIYSGHVCDNSKTLHDYGTLQILPYCHSFLPISPLCMFLVDHIGGLVHR